MCFPSITAKQDTNKNENMRKHGLFILSGFQQPKLCHKTKYFFRLGNAECGRRMVGFLGDRTSQDLGCYGVV